MIAIINRGPVSDDPDDDMRHYVVYINKEPITRFEHRRGDGLAACLRRAALAVEGMNFEGKKQYSHG